MHLPVYSPRRLIGAAALACAAALTPVAAIAATASPAAPAAASTPGCATSGLVIWLTPDTGFAGGYGYHVNFTNLSGRACTLRGYPGVSAVSLSGGRLGSRASWGGFGNAKLRTVRLASGATATAEVLIRNVYVLSSQSCRQGTAAGLRIYPPGQTASKVIPFPFSACSRSGPIYLDAGLVHK